MRRSPSIIPTSACLDVYLVLDDFGGRLGRAWRETEEEDTDRATLLRDLLSGQYQNPARIVCFNTAEGWSRDVTKDVADEVRRRVVEVKDVSPTLLEFLDRTATR